MVNKKNDPTQTLATLRLMQEIEERLKDMQPAERREALGKMIRAEEQRQTKESIQNKNNSELLEMENSIENEKMNASDFKSLARGFKVAALGMGGLATLVSGVALAMPTTVLTISDVFIFGGVVTAMAGTSFGISCLVKRAEKICQKKLTTLEEKKELFLRSLPAPAASKTAPPVPAMLKLADAFNNPDSALPALEDKNPSPKSHPKPPEMK